MRTFWMVMGTIVVALWTSPVDAGTCVNVNLRLPGLDDSALMTEAMQEEASAIWSPYGVDVRWLPDACVSQAVASFDVVVEKNDRSRTAHRSRAVVLGATTLQPTLATRAPVIVDYDAVVQTLSVLTMEQLATLVGQAAIGPDAMGRALGRVVAHEIGHVLLDQRQHNRRGLMRASFDAAELVRRNSSRYGLSAAEAARLHLRTSSARASGAAPAPPEGKPAAGR